MNSYRPAPDNHGAPEISTRIIFYVDTPGERERVLDRRDEIVDKLAEIGLRVSMTDAGLFVYLVDGNIPTLAEQMTHPKERVSDE